MLEICSGQGIEGHQGRYGKYIPLYVVHGNLLNNNLGFNNVYDYVRLGILERETRFGPYSPKLSVPTTAYGRGKYDVLLESCSTYVKKPIVFTHPRNVSDHYCYNVGRDYTIPSIEGTYTPGWMSKPGDRSKKMYYNKYFHSTFDEHNLDVHFSMMIDIEWVSRYRLSILAGEKLPASIFKLYVDQVWYKKSRGKVKAWLKVLIATLGELGVEVCYLEDVTSMLFAKVEAPKVKSLKEYQQWLEEEHSKFIGWSDEPEEPLADQAIKDSHGSDAFDEAVKRMLPYYGGGLISEGSIRPLSQSYIADRESDRSSTNI